MSNIWTRFSGLVVFGFLLGVGAGAAAQQVDMRQTLFGVDVNQALSDQTNLVAALDAYRARTGLNGPPCSLSGANVGLLTACIRSAHNFGRRIRGINGFGGMNALAFLDAAELKLNPNGTVAMDKTVEVTVTGEIEDYLFLQDPITGRGSGLLKVRTSITQQSTNNVTNAVITNQTIEYRWSIKVVNDAFRVVQFDDYDENDPFPGTMNFDQETLDRINCVAIPDCVPLRFKLWAVGKDIIVENIEKRIPPATTWTPVPNNAVNRKFYEPDDQNCIDMMFVNAPPRTLATGTGPPAYCLGRCASPLIVNTGW